MFDHPYSKAIFPNVQSPGAAFCHSFAFYQGAEPDPSCSISPAQKAAESHEVTSQNSLLLIRQPKCPQLFLTVYAVQPFFQLCYHPLHMFKYLNTRFILQSPEMHTTQKVRIHQRLSPYAVCLTH